METSAGCLPLVEPPHIILHPIRPRCSMSQDAVKSKLARLKELKQQAEQLVQQQEQDICKSSSIDQGSGSPLFQAQQLSGGTFRASLLDTFPSLGSRACADSGRSGQSGTGRGLNMGMGSGFGELQTPASKAPAASTQLLPVSPQSAALKQAVREPAFSTPASRGVPYQQSLLDATGTGSMATPETAGRAAKMQGMLDRLRQLKLASEALIKAPL